MNQDISILFEDVNFVETPPATHTHPPPWGIPKSVQTW